MHKSISTIVALFALTFIALTTQAQSDSSDAMSMPKSMDEFVNWHLDHGACGTWVEAGVTETMWVGIPAGINYTNSNTMWYEPDTQQLFHSHHMVTEDGRVISTGAGVMYWNAERNIPMTSGSGFDMGKPYNGTSQLRGMTQDAIHWTYTENAQGKTTTYNNTVTYTSPNTRTNSVVVKDSNNDPWISHAVRANPGGKMLEATKLAGTWDYTMPDGRTMRRVISWMADKHVLKQERTILGEDGDQSSMDLYLMYWDPINDHIATLYLDDHGTMIHGKIDSITTKGDDVTIISSHEGSRFGDLTMSTQMTQVVNDRTLTTSFQGMSLDGMRHGLSWSEEPSVNNRVDSDKK